MPQFGLDRDAGSSNGAVAASSVVDVIEVATCDDDCQEDAFPRDHWQLASTPGLVESACCFGLTLNTNLRLDHILEFDAHSPKVLS